MPRPDRSDAEPAGPPADRTPSGETSAPSPTPAAASTPGTPAGPGVLTTLLCERCGNENLIRVKGCWYCEKCHYKFDCYGF